MKQKIVAYRSGSLDAFIAAFVYWKLFKSAIGQTYQSVDPFTDEFTTDVTERTAPEFVISIGANVERVFGFTKFFSYEVAETFPAFEDSPLWTFVRDSNKSLTQLILFELHKAGYVDQSTPEFVVMNQFLKFRKEPGSVIDTEVARELAMLMPNMLPSDFEVLDKLLFAPASALAYFGKKSATDISQEYVLTQLTRAKSTRLTTSVQGNDLALFNSGLYEHPSVIDQFQLKQSPVLVYEIMRDGIRGKLISPSEKDNFDATTFFPNARVSGDKLVADVLLPLSACSTLFG